MIIGPSLLGWVKIKKLHVCHLRASIPSPLGAGASRGAFTRKPAALREADSVAQRWGLCVTLWEPPDIMMCCEQKGLLCIKLLIKQMGKLSL